jgi:hypothetical protein
MRLSTVSENRCRRMNVYYFINGFWSRARFSLGGIQRQRHAVVLSCCHVLSFLFLPSFLLFPFYTFASLVQYYNNKTSKN